MKLREENRRYREALEKIADPRKRDHKEHDEYTTSGCLMHIANEALNEVREEVIFEKFLNEMDGEQVV